MSVERWAVTFYGAHNERHEEPLPSLQGLCEWGIYLDWQGWLIDRTHPIYQSCQHVERHRWPFKANVSFRRSDFKKKSNGITIRSVFNNIDKWTIWRISESTYFPMVPEFRKIIAFWNIPRLCPSVFLESATRRWKRELIIVEMMPSGENQSLGWRLKFNLYCIYLFSAYRAVNTFRLGYMQQSFNAA